MTAMLAGLAAPPPDHKHSHRSFHPNAAGPGGDPAPSGSGRDQHDWSDWTRVVDPSLDEPLCERVCRFCGADQVAPLDGLVSVVVLRRRPPADGKVAA